MRARALSPSLAHSLYPPGPSPSLVRQDWDAVRNKSPIAVGMVVTKCVDEPHYLQLSEGEYVDVVEWKDDTMAICRTIRQEVSARQCQE